MARADFRIAQIEGGANVGAQPVSEGGAPAYGATAGVTGHSPFGAGSTGRAALYVWAGATLWLLLVWRAVEGY